jgi:hypothetical protein
MRFKEIINTQDFSIENLDLTEIQKISASLPRTKVIDANIAELYLVSTIEAQDLCQEKMVQVERWISIKKMQYDKAEAEAALIRAKDAGHKTAKEKEWFIQSDEQVLKIKDDLEKARVCKLWLENKIKYFSMWHYSLKSFLRRDYGIEGASNYSTFAPTPEYNEGEEIESRSRSTQQKTKDICGEIDWK